MAAVRAVDGGHIGAFCLPTNEHAHSKSLVRGTNRRGYAALLYPVEIGGWGSAIVVQRNSRPALGAARVNRQS